jgi:hypothetical protein
MPYYIGGVIQAATYNYFADFINSIYGDRNVNSTVPYLANTGYGKLPNIAYVDPENPGDPADVISAAQWNALFSRITACGIHQGTSTAPIPSTPVLAGTLIEAFNDYLTTQTLKDVIGNLVANKLVIAPGQVALTPAAPAVNSVAWTTGKQYSFQVNFGSWNNARYFFNLGGSITVAGSYTGGSSPTSDAFWNTFWTGMGIIKFGWQDSSATGGSQPSNKGFYDLTTSYQEVYRRVPIDGGVSYSDNYISVRAKLNAVAGTNGLVDFLVHMVDNDVSPVSKTGTNTINVSVYSSGGAITYPGPAVTVTPGGFTNTFTAAAAGVPLAVVVAPTAVSATVLGTGNATTGLITATASGGTGPYTYVWTDETVTPNIVTSFSNPTPAATSGPVTTTITKNLAAGTIIGGTVKVTVTDALSAVVVAYVNWGADSNLTNP